MGSLDRSPDASIPEDVLPYLDWGRVLAYCMSDTSLVPEVRDRMRDGIERLRDLLGDDFPRKAWQSRNPLVDAFIMSGPKYRRFLAARGYTFSALRRIDGFERLLAQFRSPDRDKSTEASAIADIGSRLQHVGARVAFERPLGDLRDSRRPDLWLSFSGDQVAHLELSLLGDSKAWDEADLATSAVTNALFHGPGTTTGCVRLERPLAPASVKHWVGEILRLRGEAVATGEFRCIDRPGTIRVGVSGPAGLQDLEQWAGERKMEVNTGSGADVVEDFGNRVKAKIRREQFQLPQEGPGILYIMITRIAFSADELFERLGAVEEEVYKYPHVAVLVLQWQVRLLECVLEPSALPPNESSELVVQDAPRHQVLVWNRFPNQGLSEQARAAFKSALSLKPILERTSG